MWGLNFGVAGIALGTSLGAWLNVALLVFLGYRRHLLRLDTDFWRSLVPVGLAAAATAIAAVAAVVLGRHFLHAGGLQQVALLCLAIVASVAAYGAVVLIFRKRLPLGRLVRARKT